MSLNDIRDYLRDKAKKIKSDKGDYEHKKRTNSAKFIPPFAIKAMLKISNWLT